MKIHNNTHSGNCYKIDLLASLLSISHVTLQKSELKQYNLSVNVAV